MSDIHILMAMITGLGAIFFGLMVMFWKHMNQRFDKIDEKFDKICGDLRSDLKSLSDKVTTLDKTVGCLEVEIRFRGGCEFNRQEQRKAE